MEKTYRDAHAYENTDSVVMSVSLDDPEVHSSFVFSTNVSGIFSLSSMLGITQEEGMQAFKTKIVVADVAISTVERSIVLPNCTVSIVFFCFLCFDHDGALYHQQTIYECRIGTID